MVSSAVGPTTAIFLVSRDSGSTPSFFSSTIDSRAICRASASCAGDWLAEYGICAHCTFSGGSNMPRRMRAAISRPSASSSSASVTSPCCTASGRCLA